jgi:hypothetical protein
VVEVPKVVKVEELLQVVVVANLAEIKTQDKVRADWAIKNVNLILKKFLAKKSHDHLIAL